MSSDRNSFDIVGKLVDNIVFFRYDVAQAAPAVQRAKVDLTPLRDAKLPVIFVLGECWPNCPSYSYWVSESQTAHHIRAG